MQYFPLMLDTRHCSVLMVGGGVVAERKLTLLARTDAQITLISPVITPIIQQLVDGNRVQWQSRIAALDDISAQFQLIYLATDNQALHQQMAVRAAELGVLINVVDTPSLCSFITPAIVDRGRLQVAISTAGAAPVYARTIRGRLEQALPASLAPLLDFVAANRERVKHSFINEDERRRCWERFFALNGDRFDHQTTTWFEQALDDRSKPTASILLLDQQSDPQLLPIAAVALMQQLEYVFHSEPMTVALNEFIRRDCNREPLQSLEAVLDCQRAGFRSLVVADAPTLAAIAAQSPNCLTLKAGALHGTECHDF
ncbi:bifunctional precorrin-2 dehydrogenase/sirohydrochlorin ferrochelatase [Shewanella sp. NIFS-20-20]|uniref:precorrin-2 dehydrogenase/sirohydrochlorin ferrochelatase family protein n=1 Tax=Shewanella sp. NIFS-20-20 TaxID=2853806 RepID=UPI001C496035|nr:bifunctional precorrin-2 dehydrogenase/sirohydrochlorin ferrochelatase [Shewanella sp. NIFS-20-20]MBV7314990.1 bifunctional precorrin-2 dehydrogenase/sirohydrochlorin ferrochelatase [Shewanella sp. NIFS-20-20]